MLLLGYYLNWISDSGRIQLNSPVSQYERPRAVALASSACVDKTTKIITEFTRKDFFYIGNERIKYCNRYYYELICVTWKLLMYVYLDIESLYPHLKVNWNVLMCKICIVRHLVVYIFAWCNVNFVSFPSGRLVARRMQNGSIVILRPKNTKVKYHLHSVCFCANMICVSYLTEIYDTVGFVSIQATLLGTPVLLNF